MKTYICKTTTAIRVEAEDETEAEELASLEMDIGDIDWEAEEVNEQSDTQELKYYCSTVLVRIGEYETYTNYRFRAPNMKVAKKEVKEGFDIGGDDWERVSELYSLNEVTKDEYEVLTKYI
jgi:hypothetical protein